MASAIGTGALEHSQRIYRYAIATTAKLPELIRIVPISDTDQLRETCSGMYGGSEAFIEGEPCSVLPLIRYLRMGLTTSAVAFDPSSSGQVSLVIYEWSDVGYLGVDTPDNSVGGIDRPVRLCWKNETVIS